MLANKVKLVIWDLDETFWNGTLAEGPVSAIETNIKIVVTLAQRGIISSICSKNDYHSAAERLTRLGVMDYFVLSRIEFGPKGRNVAAIIEQANLRPENVLFIDDNVLNLEEARHAAPGLMIADPKVILPVLLDLPETAGKDDSGLSRLKQYQLIDAKVTERVSSGLGNEAFLRTCDIRVEIDYKIDDEFDRILELANRTNQLNFTKIRLEKPGHVEKFRKILGQYGVTAGMVRVCDRYGDYGIVGFFVLKRTAWRNQLKHFVFSCRTMNMGIEQYVYEKLQKPEIDVVQPVANEIAPFPVVDWISEGYGEGQAFSTLTSSKKLLLVGGCELLQLSSLCSSNREEYVNLVRGEFSVRFDDPGFIAEDREKIAADQTLRRLQYWTYDDAIQFDRAVSQSEIFITAFYGLVSYNFFETREGIVLRLGKVAVKTWLKKDSEWFEQNLRYRELSLSAKYDLLTKAMDRMGRLAPANSLHFALGVNTRNMEYSERLAELGWPQCLTESENPSDWQKAAEAVAPGERVSARRHVYNRFLRNYCEKNPKFAFVDVDALIRPEDFLEPRNKQDKPLPLPDHFKRSGYIAIAEHILERLQALTPAITASSEQDTNAARHHCRELVSAGSLAPTGD